MITLTKEDIFHSKENQNLLFNTYLIGKTLSFSIYNKVLLSLIQKNRNRIFDLLRII